jgi:hypothetical protein
VESLSHQPRELSLIIWLKIFVDSFKAHHEESQLLGKDKRLSVSLEAHFRFIVIQEVSKIDVEELSAAFIKHKVTSMSISDP